MATPDRGPDPSAQLAHHLLRVVDQRRHVPLAAHLSQPPIGICPIPTDPGKRRFLPRWSAAETALAGTQGSGCVLWPSGKPGDTSQGRCSGVFIPVGDRCPSLSSPGSLSDVRSIGRRRPDCGTSPDAGSCLADRPDDRRDAQTRHGRPRWFPRWDGWDGWECRPQCPVLTETGGAYPRCNQYPQPARLVTRAAPQADRERLSNLPRRRVLPFATR